VGWGFDCDAQLADCGAVENPIGDPFVQPIDMGFWTDTSFDPMPFVISRRYEYVKYFDLLAANPVDAYGKMLWIAAETYKVITRNCLDDVFDVLSAYGVKGLPTPTDTIAPDVWFDRVAAPKMSVTAFHWRSDRPEGDAAAMARLTPWQAALRNLCVGPPPWRVEGRPEHAEFQRRVRAAKAQARAPN
jgi:hypothetical protein